MGSRFFVRVVCVLVLGSLSAQNVTVPGALNGVEGGGGTNIPFGTNQACRIQCIYDAIELPWSGPRIITGLQLRADWNGGAATAAKGYLDVSVLVSTTSKNSATSSTTFADNRGVDATWVMLHQPLLLPAQAATTVAPRAANIPLVFQVPWVYGLTPAVGSLPAPSNLLVEVHIHSQPSGQYRVDNLSSCIAAPTSFGNIGPACAPLGGANAVLSGDASMMAGSAYSWRLASGPASMPFLLALNLSNAGGLGGNPAWPLPYPMFDPANPSLPSAALAPLGWPAPDCWLNIDPAVMLGGALDASGNGIYTGLLPAGRQFLGTTLYAQALVFAPSANPLRFISTLGLAATVCGPLGVTRVHSFYNPTATPPQPEPTVGTIAYGSAFVFDVM